MLVCIPLAWLWLVPNDMKEFSKSLKYVSGFISNFLFYKQSGYFDTAAELKPLLHTWSLAVEEQYYVFFPLLLIITWRPGIRWTVGILGLAAIVSLGYAHRGLFHNPAAAFYLLPTRFWELLIGALVAFYFFTRNNFRDTAKHASGIMSQLFGLAGLLLIVYAVFAFDRTTPFPGLYALVPTLGTALIIVFANEKNLVGRLLANRALVGIGLISYSAYLWHQPLFAFARHRSLGDPGTPVIAALSLTAIALAYLSWRYVEVPFRNRNWLSRRQILYFGLGGTLFFVIAGYAGKFDDGLMFRYSGDAKKFLLASTDRNPRSSECQSHPGKYIRPADSCIYGNSKNVTGALLGDSHANALAHEIGSALNGMHGGIRQMTHAGCPPVMDIYLTDKDSDYRCADYYAAVYDFLASTNSIRNIIFVARWTLHMEGTMFNNGEGGQELGNETTVSILEDNTRTAIGDDQRPVVLREKYRETIAGYLDIGKRVVLVYPILEVGWDVPNTLAKVTGKREIRDSDVSTSYSVFKSRNARVIDALDSIGEHPNLIRIRPDRVLCNTYVKNRCITHLNGVPLYNDDDHLTSTGARLIANRIVEQLLRHGQ